MAYIAAPPISWGGNAPQAVAVTVVQASFAAVTSPLTNGAKPAPANYSLVNTSAGHSI